jgi:predicted CoA-binding protein
MSKNTLGEVLGKYRVIAVVGLSSDPAKPSYGVASYMKEHGYRIVPVNPFVEEVLGEKSYKSLLEMPVEIQRTIEIVDIFRRAQDVPPIVEQAVKLKRAFGKPYVVWMQLGIVNQEAAQAAVQAGLTVVMDRCIMVEHERLSQAQNQRSNRS